LGVTGARYQPEIKYVKVQSISKNHQLLGKGVIDLWGCRSKVVAGFYRSGPYQNLSMDLQQKGRTQQQRVLIEKIFSAEAAGQSAA